MEVAAIMEALKENRDRKFAREALNQAIAQQDDITPLLIAEFIPAAERVEVIDATPYYMRHIYALFLLAQFRETKAYQPIIDFFLVPGETVMDITGDVVTENLGDILASVCDGNLDPIKQTIENTDINEYVRSSAMKALVVLAVEGDVSRDSVLDYFEEIWPKFRQERDGSDDFMYHSLLRYSLNLCPHKSLAEVIRHDYQTNRILPEWSRIKDLDKAIDLGAEESIQTLASYNYGFITDVIEKMEWWACFREIEPKQKRSVPAGLVSGFENSKKDNAKRKKKRQAQKQSRKQNRSKKKR